MRVLCPACDAQYDVPDRLIGAGRRLRCARCDHDWPVRPPPSAGRVEALPLAASAEPPAIPRAAASPGPQAAPLAGPLAAPAPAPGSGAWRLWLAWAVSVGVVLLALAGLWWFRQPLAEAWPPLLRLYALLG